MLIDQNGEKQGIVSIEEALDVAKNASLDLVQVSPSNSNPVICKLMDYGKHLFSKKKNVSSSRTKTKKTVLKALFFQEIRLKLASVLEAERYLIVI